MIKIVRPFLFIVFVMLMYTTSLAISFSRIGTINRNLFHNAGLNHELMNDLPDDSLSVKDETIYEIVDVEPSFPGGPIEMAKWIQANVKYPILSMEKGEHGTVYVRFVVNEDGSISDVQIRKGVVEALDNEAMRVISIMPNWTSGKINGKTVRASYTLPISFRLG
jgi:protein TonB